jgi:hypothetical protein
MSKKTAVKKSQKQPATKQSPAVAKKKSATKSATKVKAVAKAAPKAKAKAAPKAATKAKPAAAKAKAKAPVAKKAKVTVESYVAGLKGWQATIVNNLRKLLKVSAPGTREGIRDDQPAFEVNGPFAFIKADEQSVNFGFWRGDELDDPHKLLKKAGGKIRVVALSSKATLPEDPLVAMIQKAVVLNLAKGDPTAAL